MTIKTTTKKLTKKTAYLVPGAWDETYESWRTLVSCQAGRAHVIERAMSGLRGTHPKQPTPKWEHSDQEGTYAYELYEDGSFRFVNNACDEVYFNCGDFADYLYDLDPEAWDDGDRALLTRLKYDIE
jgi:hypothetical protein